ncbi:MAG: extracellular solute-binding protein [Desulfobacterales bacterium]|nr:extracellular solute-binding protein [Desulfobacterales bacterium]
MTDRLKTIGLTLMLVLSTLVTAGPAPAAPLDEVIAGAKKEGTLSLMLSSRFPVKSMTRLENEIKKRFDVDLKIQFTPVTSMTRAVAGAIMEYKAGVVPTYDVMNLSQHVAEGTKAGIFEPVDWRSLITKDTNPDILHDHPATRDAILAYTGTLGLMYNPEKVPAAQVPKTLQELADPKWKNKLAINSSPNAWTRWAFVLGKEKLISDLRAILANGTLQGQYAEIQARYLLGEVSFCIISSIFVKNSQDKKMPAAYQSLDFADITNYSLVVRKGAKHPNAAKLVALYLASAAGSKFIVEESGAGNMYYPGNYEHDFSLQNKKQGIREVFTTREPDILDFYFSKEFKTWQKDVKLVLDTGGRKIQTKKKKTR